jgi:oligopeptide transport system substrate-binding protein
MDPLTVDPRKNGDQITSTFLFHLYEGLTRLKSDDNIEFALADSVFISEDNKTYQFHLREAFWSDGHLLTAYDFEYSWKKTINPKFPALSPQLFFPIKNAEAAAQGLVPLEEVGIKALDKHTLRIELQNPTPYFLSLISFCNFYPIPRHIEEANPHWESQSPEKLVVSGPFKIVDWKRKQKIVCEKNELYWNADQVTQKSLEIRIIDNPYVTLQLFDQDELDFVSLVLCSLPLEALEPYRQDGTLNLYPLGGTTFCSFNMHQYPFHNAHIRKAFSYAIDRKFIVDQVTRFSEIPAFRCLPPCLIQNEDAPSLCIFDEALARKHLNAGMQELGIFSNHANRNSELSRFLNNLTLIFISTHLNKKIVEALQQQWKKVLGFNVRLESCDYSSYIQQFNKKTYSLGLSYWLAQFNDPMSIFERFKNRALPKNFPGYESEEFNELLRLSSMEANPTKRKKILAGAEACFLADMPLAPIYHYSHVVLCKPYLTGVQIPTTAGIHFHQCKLNRPSMQTSGAGSVNF